jgi:cardiolipin synthase
MRSKIPATKKIQKAFTSACKWCSSIRYTKTECFFIVVGVLSIFFILINFFTDLGDNAPVPSLDGTVTLDEPEKFAEVLATAIGSQVQDGSPITILTNGDEFLPDLLEEIKHASTSVHITNFIWDDGEFGNTIFEALIEKANQGLDVKVLVDAVGGNGANEDLIEELTQAGGKVEFFRPIRWWNLNRIDRRTHVRDFVIDDRVAYIGGTAIADSWLGDATEQHQWHDFMFKTEGATAESLSNVFATLWSQTTGEFIIPSESTAKAENNTSTSTKFITYFSNPSPDLSSNMEHILWLSIVAATSSIHIENPYVLPNKTIRDALEAKARQGVEVVIIAPGENTDAHYARWASEASYYSLLESGIKIYEYQPARTHAKIMIVDGKWSIIGSANMDNRSNEINLELIMGVLDEPFAKALEAEFQEDLSKSKEIKFEEWSRKHYLLYPLRLFSRLFIQQY